MFTILAYGSWSESQLRTTWSETSSRPAISEVEALIEESWARAAARPGVHLFDGPMCRLESFAVTGDGLTLDLSPTSYKPFLGTNLSNPHVADRHGRAALVNPVGMSACLLTADKYLVLGQRNSHVAYYPDRIHPFAGALEPADAPAPFSGIRRELREELSFGDADVASLACIGLAEDDSIRQPELFFAVTTTLTRAEVESRLDRTEHRSVYALPATAAAVEQLLAAPQRLTPVAAASLLLWGRGRFGDGWFSRTAGSTVRPA